MTKTCLQCGAILPSGISACRFCDLSFKAEVVSNEGAAADLRRDSEPTRSGNNGEMDAIILSSTESVACEATFPEPDSEWRGELANRVEAYRVRRRKLPIGATQSKLPFAEPTAAPEAVVQGRSVALAEPPTSSDEDFAFTIAIGRFSPERRAIDRRMMIDVSIPTERYALADPEDCERHAAHAGLYPVAPMEDRRLAGVIDAACLLFACGGFLALFGSLGGQFTLSKLNAAVCVAAVAVVYLQYFALFTVFGGTTPGMMLRGLQVVSFSGEAPTPRQMLLRSVGYLLSAGTCFLGFMWAVWDEDALTWHDRISKTYLSSAETYADVESRRVAHTR